MRSLYQAGKMLEQAVLLARDMNQFDKIGGFAERGALLYRQGKDLKHVQCGLKMTFSYLNINICFTIFHFV
jgi:hypothetical protein